MGGASRWWLHHALESLNTSLDGKLQLYRGEPLAILSQLASDTSAQGVYWNRCYEPWRIARDGEIKTALKAADIEVQSFNGSLLCRPGVDVRAPSAAAPSASTASPSAPAASS